MKCNTENRGTVTNDKTHLSDGPETYIDTVTAQATAYKRYAASEKGRAARKVARMRYKRSEKGIAANKAYAWKRKQTEAGISYNKQASVRKARRSHRALLDLMDRGVI